jgi:effector-binding domain-containing protein
MIFPGRCRLGLIALVPAVAIWATVAAQAQSPASPAPAVSASPAPATTPPPANPSPVPSTPPASVATPPATSAAPAPAVDAFGDEVTLEPKMVVMLKGNASWDSAFDTLIDSLKSLSTLLDKQGIKPAGNAMIVYTSTDDTGFSYLAEIPIDQQPKDLAKNMSVGKSPEGKALKFVHHGSYDNMDNTYEAITNHLDDKRLEAKDSFVEEYLTDPLKTAEDKLVINVYVPLR